MRGVLSEDAKDTGMVTGSSLSRGESRAARLSRILLDLKCTQGSVWHEGTSDCVHTASRMAWDQHGLGEDRNFSEIAVLGCKIETKLRAGWPEGALC